MDFADKRPPPKTTAQAFELAFDPEGDNVFVLSSLFPQAFGRKQKKKAPEDKVEEDDDGTESDEDITIYLHSPGGHVESGDTIHDMIGFVRPRVRIIGTGWVASAGTHIYLAAEKEDRLCLPNTRFMIHQPLGGIGGQAMDIEIEDDEVLKALAEHKSPGHARPIVYLGGLSTLSDEGAAVLASWKKWSGDLPRLASPSRI